MCMCVLRERECVYVFVWCVCGALTGSATGSSVVVSVLAVLLVMVVLLSGCGLDSSPIVLERERREREERERERREREREERERKIKEREREEITHRHTRFSLYRAHTNKIILCTEITH